MRSLLVATLLGGSLAVLPWTPAHADGTGTVTTLTGTGVLDAAPATQAIVTPYDAATGVDGSLYLADPDNARVRVADPTGTIYTVADGTATFGAHRLVIGDDGDVIVADRGNRRVRRIDRQTDEVTTVAGTGAAGTGTPNAPATTQPVTPDDVAYDAAANRVLIADSAAGRVYAVGTNGKLDVVAGTGTSAALESPVALAIGPDGALYVGGQGGDIRRVAGGTSTVVAGGGSTSSAPDGTAATAAALPPITALAVDAAGTLYFGDPTVVGSPTGFVRTVDAQGVLGSIPGVPCAVAKPAVVSELDSAGRLLVTCRGALWRRAADGTWTRLAGDVRDVLPVPDGTFFLDAGFRPRFHGLGVVRSGGDLVFGHGYSLYRLDGEIVRRVAGSGDPGEVAPDGTPALAAPIKPCRGLTALSDGTVVFAEAGRVRAVTQTGTLTTLAGGGTAQTFTDGMTATALTLPSCPQVAPAPGGDLYVLAYPQLYRLDITAGTLHLVAQPMCGGVPARLLAGAGGPTLYAAGADRLCRYDTATGTGQVAYLAGEVTAMDLAPDGRLLLATSTGLQLLTPDGALTTLSSGGTDDSTETTLDDVRLDHPAGVLLDDDGGIVWQDSRSWLRRVVPGWSVSPVAGVTGLAGTMTYDGDVADVTLTWTPPATPYDAYEATATDPRGNVSGQTLPAGATTVTFPRLNAGEAYVFEVRPTRGNGAERAPNHPFTAVTPAYSAPATDPGVYVYSAGAGQTAGLVWTAPAGAAETEVRVTPGTTPPAGIGDGTRVYRGTGTGAVATGLTHGQTYAVTVFGVDALGAATPAWTQVFAAGAAPRVRFRSGPYWATSEAAYTWTVRGGAADVACRLDGQALPCADDGVTLSGLAAGPHRLEVRPVGPFGTGPATGHDLVADLTAPVPRTEIRHPVTLATSATVTNASTDATSGIATYDLRYRRTHYTGLAGPFVSPAGWVGSTTPTRTLTGLKRGYTYCFSSRATDRAGHTSRWSAERCAYVALDDRALSASAGWTRGTSAAHYLGTYSRTTQYGRTLTISGVRTGRVVLVATKCPTCGVVGVYVNGALVSKLDLALPYTERQVVIDQGWFGLREGTVTLKTLSSGKPVVIDGIAFASDRY